MIQAFDIWRKCTMLTRKPDVLILSVFESKEKLSGPCRTQSKLSPFMLTLLMIRHKPFMLLAIEHVYVVYGEVSCTFQQTHCPPLVLSSPMRFSTASIANEKVIFKCSRPKMLLRNCIIAFAHLPDCSPLSQRFSIQFLLSHENVSLRKKG